MLDFITQPLIEMGTQFLSFLPALAAFLIIMYVGRWVVKVVKKMLDRMESMSFVDKMPFDVSDVVGAILMFFVWYFALLQFGIDLKFVIDFVLGSMQNIITIVAATLGLGFALSAGGQAKINAWHDRLTVMFK